MKNGKNGRKNGMVKEDTPKTVRNSADLKVIMGALVTDLRAQRVTPMIANAMCNASGKLIKIVEMEYKYGRHKGKPKRMELVGR